MKKIVLVIGIFVVHCLAASESMLPQDKATTVSRIQIIGDTFFISPRITWQAVSGAKSCVLIVEAFDRVQYIRAPKKTKEDLWVVYNIQPSVTSFAANESIKNEKGIELFPYAQSSFSYFNMVCNLYALDVELLPRVQSKAELLQVMQGHVIEKVMAEKLYMKPIEFVE